ncbi:MAG TPA: cytochrome P450 [Acidimicrobiales bacterium]|nr:cytochrome P450 [Acidimicrobiales bacterium]
MADALRPDTETQTETQTPTQTQLDPAVHLAAWGGWGPDVRDDPHPLLARLVAEAPVHAVTLADGHPAHLVVGHAAARQALNDPRISKDMQAALADDPGVVAEGLPGPAFSRHMLNVDPPDHTRLRRLVAPAFGAARVAALEAPIQAIADGLLDDLARDSPGPDAVVDLVGGYARPLPFQVIGELLGVPSADRADLHRWFATLLSPWFGDPPPEVVDASDRIVAYLDDLVAAKRYHPGDDPGHDLVSELVAASVGGDRLTHQELLSTLFQLVVAGHDTTTSLIGNAVVALLDHPDQLALVVDDPGALPGAIEELLRFAAPVPHATFRYATEDLELDGVPVPAGRQVLVCLAAAGRDPDHVDRPDQLDVTRNALESRHLAFGHGIHFCPGAGLARLEARVALGSLLARHPRLRPAGDRSALRWAHGDGLVLRGLTDLPVILGPRACPADHGARIDGQMTPLAAPCRQ